MLKIKITCCFYCCMSRVLGHNHSTWRNNVLLGSNWEENKVKSFSKNDYDTKFLILECRYFTIFIKVKSNMKKNKNWFNDPLTNNMESMVKFTSFKYIFLLYGVYIRVCSHLFSKCFVYWICNFDLISMNLFVKKKRT